MTEEIKKWLNDKDFILTYRFNFDKANEVNEDLKNYVKQLQNEKQQLISFLKEKIKEYKLCFPEVAKALQEVLDFVRGGKND